MFSLPNIRAMHEHAEKERKASARRRTFTCDKCGSTFNVTKCREAGKRYLVAEFHDSLSVGAKGFVRLCPDCHTGGDPDGYFTCADCGLLHADHYSWESYRVTTGDGLSVCIPCAAKRCLAPDSRRWLRSAAVIRTVTKSMSRLEKFGPRHCSCIGSEIPYPFGVVSFRDTDEYEKHRFDFYNKMNFGWPDGRNPVADARACLLAAFKFYRKVTLVLGERSQYQLYADVLVDPASRRKEPFRFFDEDDDLGLARGERHVPAGCFPDIITKGV